MTKEDFLNKIHKDCSEILYLGSKHMMDKLYKNDEIINETKNIEFFSNYKNYHLYLNDYAGVIYSRYASSVNNIYIEMCGYLNVEVDNKYTLEHTIVKLEKQTPQLLLGLTDEDIQKQTIIHFDEKLEAIDGSSHYNNNLNEFKNRVDKLKSNIILVKNALQYR
ncbi:MAG: hypothetical protein U9O56_04045 [Campylobacterota bacterium]|nr:hypothetical protein [Campylobacterota bacterium]